MLSTAYTANTPTTPTALINGVPGTNAALSAAGNSSETLSLHMIYVDLFFSHLYSLPAYHQPNLSQRTASFIIIIIENMGTQESFEKNISEYKNSERIGVYRELEDQGRNLV